MIEGIPLYVSEVSRSLAPNGSVSLDAGRLGVPFAQPFVVQEIRFKIGPPSTNTNLDQYLGGSIRVRLQMGKFHITNGAIPIWNLGVGVQKSIENAQLNQSGGIVSSPYYRWVLPRPLLVPPGGSLTATLFRSSSDGVALVNTSYTVPVFVSYAGLQLPKTFNMPKEIDVPWVTAFLDETAARTATTSTPSTSNEWDLANPFSRPLQIQRLIGRIDGIDTTSNREGDYIGPGVKTTIRDSLGYDIAPIPTEFNQIFSPTRRELTFKRQLGIRQRIIVVNTTKPATETMKFGFNGGTATFNILMPHVSMIGWRKEAI